MKHIFKISRIIILVQILVLTAIFSGCSSLGTYNAATGRNEFIIIPTDSEVTMGQDIHQSILRENSLSQNIQYVNRVKDIGRRLASVSDRKDYEYNFYLIERDEMNAFTTPGGNIYLYKGLADKLKSDGQIAAVLAHEIGHCAARHSVKKFQAALGYNLLGNLILSRLDMEDSVKSIAAMSSNVIMNIVTSSYSRKDEHQADKLGLKYMYLAGYDLDEAVKAFEVLKKEAKGPNMPLIFRTHPYLDDRIGQIKNEINRIRANKNLYVSKSKR